MVAAGMPANALICAAIEQSTIAPSFRAASVSRGEPGASFD
jgi:hypothetical protein